MANPRVFVSSTYYDLKHIRSSLDIFIESLGYESVLSEKGNIAYSPDVPLDESCYREVSSVDIFVLIVGGRYGSEVSGAEKEKSKEFYEHYESVTKKEFEEANKKDIPIYILVENSVFSEYQTYLRNKNNTGVSYAHVDSVNIFKFIEQILSLPRKNPTKTFEKFSDIEIWLKEQWAGLFRELLRKMSEQKKFSELSLQVDGLKEINTTLKTYLESLMKAVSPSESTQIIETESQRLTNRERSERIKRSQLGSYLIQIYDLQVEDIIKAVTNSKSAVAFAKALGEVSPEQDLERFLIQLLTNDIEVFDELNKLRTILELSSFNKPAKRTPNK